MARSLSFKWSGGEASAEIEKLDRAKLYGWVDKKAVDRDGKECFFGSVSADGLHLFGKESFETGYIDAQGAWLEKEQLLTLGRDGKVLNKVESSFNQPVELGPRVSCDEYLDHVVKSVYQLQATPALLELVRGGEGFLSFSFNYTASFNPDPAFLVENEGELFMVVAEPCRFDFIGPVESVALVEDEADEEEDAMDFSMF
ncbi:MAG: hypothetical protein RL095_3163 [Verrucomicrobiota bacterium]|jgi:hypothetical protein